MASFNRVIIIGNLTRDPEYKQLTSGQAVCRLGIATNRQFKNKQSGTTTQEVCYIDCDVWGAQAESCRQYLQKGRPVLVEGRLKLDSWQDTNGQTRSKHSIVAERVQFLGSAQGSAESSMEDGREPEFGATEAEKDILNQIKQVKDRTQSGYALKSEGMEEKPKRSPKKSQDFGAATASIGGEINFQDEPPFQDELPF